MIEIIPSEYVRNILKDKRTFTDFEKATLIWNSPIATRRERLDSLGELSVITDDERLKQQIVERIEYEQAVYQKYIENQNNDYVYVVFDSYQASCGYFADYELARKFGINECAEYEMTKFTIEKQLIYSEARKGEVIKPWASKHNLIEVNIFSERGYDGRENARVTYNAEGEIIYFYSREMPEADRDRVDELDRTRFEYHFFKIPAFIEDGTVAKVIDDDSFVVTDLSTSSWDEYMERTDMNPLYYDYSDIQTVVYSLNEDGSWTHEHINPMYLEPSLPELEKDNEKSAAYINALTALGEFIKTDSKDKNEEALMASRKYAEICRRNKRNVFDVDDIEKVMG